LIRDIHSKGIIHGDIKFANMLLCPNMNVRLCDFSNAAFMTKGYFPRSITERFCSPYRLQPGIISLLRREEVIYVFGIAAWELFMNMKP